MSPRGEPVPFSFVAEADRFRSNVTPPPKPRPDPRSRAGAALFGLTIVSGLVGSLLVGLPALDPGHQPGHGKQAAREGR
ncbi:hypothetical protein DVA86_24815 [Streptomyces armeniacus]|uniref:Uncharacterized protein n=1 Tax=Streptomyces armeniacus TaxID=83291 RepID=A0A345XUS2_9ACTN|nr:hypothetical protein [Streptomyces armeniacus]AXK35388.1 hypothetical protein DVA86_24815 [Streptomyces armeniacus]